MPSGICSRRADFAGTITPVGSLVGGGSLPAADRIKLAAPRLNAGFSPALPRATPLPRCYGMAVLPAAYPDGMTGEPIWSLQSMPHLDGGSGHGRQGGRAGKRTPHVCFDSSRRTCYGDLPACQAAHEQWG